MSKTAHARSKMVPSDVPNPTGSFNVLTLKDVRRMAPERRHRAMGTSAFYILVERYPSDEHPRLIRNVGSCTRHLDMMKYEQRSSVKGDVTVACKTLTKALRLKTYRNSPDYKVSLNTCVVRVLRLRESDANRIGHHSLSAYPLHEQDSHHCAMSCSRAASRLQMAT